MTSSSRRVVNVHENPFGEPRTETGRAGVQLQHMRPLDGPIAGMQATEKGRGLALPHLVWLVLLAHNFGIVRTGVRVLERDGVRTAFVDAAEDRSAALTWTNPAREAWEWQRLPCAIGERSESPKQGGLYSVSESCEIDLNIAGCSGGIGRRQWPSLLSAGP